MKAPGTKRLKLKYDGPLSKFAFKVNLRHYIMEIVIRNTTAMEVNVELACVKLGVDDDTAVTVLGGAVQVDPFKPTLKAPGTKHLKP